MFLDKDASCENFDYLHNFQGYGKDAAEIARHAIEHARKNDFDVVLIDTAGRMQDNEPLMRALAKVKLNIHADFIDCVLVNI